MHSIFIIAFLLFCQFLCFGNIEVQGHRGNRGALPENTLPSFASAIEAGADTLEMDLLLSKDGAIVIHHDYFLNRKLCTYLNDASVVDKILIRDLTLSEIKKIDCGSKQNRHFPSQTTLPRTHIPTLEQVFSLVKGKNIKLNLEIKRDARHPEYTFSPEVLAKKVIEATRKNGLERQIYFSSFDQEVLQAIRNSDPEAEIGFIVVGALDKALETATALQAQVISPEHSLLAKKEDVKKLQASGLRVIPWTVNDPKRWQQLIEMEVDGIITDFPEDLVSFLHKIN
jgi:glycerophosphoryl diester phosphodiesterase